jgi:hypothetical protein
MDELKRLVYTTNWKIAHIFEDECTNQYIAQLKKKKNK